MFCTIYMYLALQVVKPVNFRESKVTIDVNMQTYILRCKTSTFLFCNPSPPSALEMGMLFTVMKSFCNPSGMSFAFVYLRRLKLWMTCVGFQTTGVELQSLRILEHTCSATSGHYCAWNTVILSVNLLYTVSVHFCPPWHNSNLPTNTRRAHRDDILFR